MTPKYKISDDVWFINDNQVVHSKITGIFAVYDKAKMCTEKILYNFIKASSPSQYDYTWFEEDKIFLTKEELIKSL